MIYENAFRVTGPLWAESIGGRWILSQIASNTRFYAFFDVSLNKRLNKQSESRWFETVIVMSV